MVPYATVDVIFSSKRAPISFVIFKKNEKDIHIFNFKSKKEWQKWQEF